MTVSKSSALLQRSESSQSAVRRSANPVPFAVCLIASAMVIAAAVVWVYRTGRTLWFGDAEAHLNIARRIIDSRTPGWNQLGSPWLPLPHLLMIPLVRNDWLWKTGLAGAITSGVAMLIAVGFLFAAARRIFGTAGAGFVAAAVFLLNPNSIYLGSIPMTEPVFFACLSGLLYFTICFSTTRGWGALTGAGLAACAGTMTRYEGWFLLPFVAACICARGGRKRWAATAVFCLLAGAGPVLWLLHNRWYFGDPFYFYRGPYSAIAIQGATNYPGKGDWLRAAHYFLTAGRLVIGFPAILLGIAGIVLAVKRRIIWAPTLLALPPLFYVWSMHSAATPIFVPNLWPHGFYNTRYGLELLPLIAIGAAALARSGKAAALATVVISLAPFLIHLNQLPVTMQEADVNSRGRREWIQQAAADIKRSARPHDTYFTSFGDITGVYRTLGIPLRATLTGDDDVEYAAAVARPDLFLHADRAVAESGDEVQKTIARSQPPGVRYDLIDRTTVKGEPVIEIYSRDYENPVR